jgi:hypothetical protein
LFTAFQLLIINLCIFDVIFLILFLVMTYSFFQILLLLFHSLNLLLMLIMSFLSFYCFLSFLYFVTHLLTLWMFLLLGTDIVRLEQVDFAAEVFIIIIVVIWGTAIKNCLIFYLIRTFFFDSFFILTFLLLA